MDKASRLLIFTDPGLDDAMALIYLIKKLPNDTKIDVFCVGGNSSATQSFINTCSLFGKINRDNLVIWRTDSIPQKSDPLINVHGMDFLSLPDTNYPSSRSYPENWKGVSEKCDVIVLSPCTVPYMMNIDCACVENLIVMGGCETQPNYNGLEFNQAMDATAFSKFIGKYIDKVRMITVDSCRDKRFDVFKSDYKDFLSEKSIEYGCYRRYEKYALDRKGKLCIPYDLIAAYALLNPEKIIYEKRALIGVDNLKPLCMVGTTLQSSSEFWNCIWRD